MKRLKSWNILAILFMFMQTAQSCAGDSKKQSFADTAIVQQTQEENSKEPVNDEQLFRTVLAKFKSVVEDKNKAAITAFFYFPLQTLPQWTNDELKNSTISPQDGLLKQKEFAVYFDDIFTKDVLKLIPASKEEDLSEIEKNTPENYYITLQKVTDKGSALYELQKQYTQDNGQETSFGFVFGKVGGTYKVISYYRPWPLK